LKEEPDISVIEPLYKFFNFISQPVAVAAQNGNIEWANSQFLRFFKNQKRPANLNEITEFPSSGITNPFSFFSEKLNSNVFVQPVSNKDSYDFIVILDTKDSSRLEKDFLNQKLRGFAHDLNNILSNILNSIDVIKSRISREDENYELFENISNNSNRAIEIISSLLNLDNDPIVQKRRISIKTLLKDLHRAFAVTLPEKIELELKLENNLKDVYGNYTNLYSSLLNLCVNAKESIEDNGKIVLAARNENIDTEINAVNGIVRKGNYVVINVEDNGAGIPEEELNKIFEIGFSTKIKNYEGGIGLSNVLEIVKGHNGFITVESKPGRGTKFSIYLPAAKDNDIESGRKNKTLLITEDEEALAGLLSDLFGSYNYNVITASSGKETLQKLEEGLHIDLLLIDKELPDMSGIDCIKEIRNKNLSFPVVLATGSIDDEDKAFGEKFANGYLQKPYNFEKALTVVKDLIG